jgi:hypothetical protein
MGDDNHHHPEETMSRTSDANTLADLAESGHGFSIIQMPLPHYLEDEPVARAWSRGERLMPEEDYPCEVYTPRPEQEAQVRAYQALNKKVDEDRKKRLRKTP